MSGWLLAAAIPVALGLLVAGWGTFEGRWDRRLFHRRGPDDFVVNLRAREALRLMEQTPGLIVLDVRPRHAYRRARLPGAVHCPYAGEGFEAGVLRDLPRDRPLLVYCDGGFRSRQALPVLRAAGFRRIHHLHRGLLSWKGRQVPVETGATSGE